MFVLQICIVLFIAAVVAHEPKVRECPDYYLTHFNDTSSDPKDLRFVYRKFLEAIGGVNNLAAHGPLQSGYRKINWDAEEIPFMFPPKYFNSTISKGISFHTRGRQFFVSNPSPPPVDDRFDSFIRRESTLQFQSYSPNRLFSPVKSNKFSMVFRVVGHHHRARIFAFGAVFADVDHPTATNIRYFDDRGCKIAHVRVRARDGGLSFSGLIVKDRSGQKLPVINKVTIKLGSVSMERFSEDEKCYDSNGDLVVLDDVVYSEPVLKNGDSIDSR